jgi:uncharacterized protein involved in exopolysaccharide biosynthesis
MNGPWPPPQRPLLPAHAGELPPPIESAPPGPTPLEWGLLALDCLRRRKLWAVLAFGLTLAAAAAFQSRKVPEYRVETKILTQAQSLPATLRNVLDEMPTRSAWEIVHRRENLVAIIKQSKLLSDPALVKRLTARGRSGSGSAEVDPTEALVTILDRALVVLSSEGTLTIQLDWPNPRQAYDIVQAALQNFLEARRVQEIVAMDDVVAVLENRAAVIREEYDRTVEQARRRAPSTERATARATRPSAEAVRLKASLEAKQRAIRELDDFRMRRLAEVQSQLDQARNSFSDAHPTVIRLREDVAALTHESPQVAALRAEEVELRRQYAQISPDDLGHLGAVPAVPRNAEEDQGVREARQNYEQIVGRLNGVLVERDAARAAFKYRYNVIWPPQVPTEPVGGGWKKLLVVGILAGALLAVAVVVAPDLIAGRIVMRWQLERSLGIPVVGELGRK